MSLKQLGLFGEFKLDEGTKPIFKAPLLTEVFVAQTTDGWCNLKPLLRKEVPLGGFINEACEFGTFDDLADHQIRNGNTETVPNLKRDYISGYWFRLMLGQNAQDKSSKIVNITGRFRVVVSTKNGVANERTGILDHSNPQFNLKITFLVASDNRAQGSHGVQR